MRKLIRLIWNTKGLARWIFLVGLVVTIGLTLFAAKALKGHHQHQQRREFARVLRRSRRRQTLW